MSTPLGSSAPPYRWANFGPAIVDLGPLAPGAGDRRPIAHGMDLAQLFERSVRCAHRPRRAVTRAPRPRRTRRACPPTELRVYGARAAVVQGLRPGAARGSTALPAVLLTRSDRRGPDALRWPHVPWLRPDAARGDARRLRIQRRGGRQQPAARVALCCVQARQVVAVPRRRVRAL
eukprot:1002984-Prymnesium_polylepis.1